MLFITISVGVYRVEPSHTNLGFLPSLVTKALKIVSENSTKETHPQMQQQKIAISVFFVDYIVHNLRILGEGFWLPHYIALNLLSLCSSNVNTDGHT